MNPKVRNVLAVIAGVVVGGFVNMGLLIAGSLLIGVPEGVNVWDPESLAQNISRFQIHHYITPFAAHAIGTLVGALVVSLIATSKRLFFALFIGGFFLIGGIVNVINLPAPLWFEALDLIVAYFPMAFLGWKLSGKE